MKHNFLRFPLRGLSLLLCALLLLCCWGCKNPQYPDSSGMSSELEEISSDLSSEPEDIPSRPVVTLAPIPTPSPTPEPTPTPAPTPEPLRVSLKADASLYEKADAGNPIATLPAGQTVEVQKTNSMLWYAATGLETGGYLYAESLYRVAEDGSISPKNMFEEYAERKFSYLQERLPHGNYWNHMGLSEYSYGQEVTFVTTETPCVHHSYGELYCNFYNGATKQLFSANTLCECLGFASLLSDHVFGTELPLHTFRDEKLLRVGDHIRLNEYEHSMIVKEIHEDYLVVAEVNANYEDCLISWTTQFTWSRLRNLSWDSRFISRYPLRPDGSGGYVPWE